MFYRKAFRFHRQLDSVGCGCACVQMICDYFGKTVSYQYINNMFNVTKDGVSLLSIEKVFNNLGITAESLNVDIDALAAISLPAIIHWNKNHFVILYKISKNFKYFYIADPAKGFIKYSFNQFVTYWGIDIHKINTRGIIMTAKPNPNFNDMRIIESEAHRSGKQWEFIYNYIRTYKAPLIHIVLGLAVGSVLQLLLPFMTQAIVDNGIKSSNIRLIWLILIGELLIIMGKTASDFIRRWLLLHISIRVNVTLVSDFFIKLLKLPMSFFDSKLLGDLLQRINDHSRVQSFLTNQTLNVLFTFISFLILGIVLLIYNRLIFIVYICGSALYTGWICMFFKNRRVLDYELFEQQAINQSKTYQFVTSLQEIKLQGCERRRRFEWEDIQADIFRIQLKSMKLQQIQESGCIFINECKNILITVLSATAVIDGQITIGAMLAIQFIVGQLNSPIEQLISFIYSVQDVLISLDRINEVHNAQEECYSKDKRTSLSNSKSIELVNVSFKYDSDLDPYTLDNISVKIPEGKITAIVGSSGSGKTTLLKLLLGYYQVQKGSIKIGDSAIDEYNIKWWRNQCGVVLQDGVIFSESIGHNIAVGDDVIDKERLIKAAKISNIHDFIMSLPLKYDTVIGKEGMGLSQGQKQRILIARAVYKNPDFIFLDEATNALDAENEKLIVQNLNEFYKGKTVIIVAHRLSTVISADQIVVIENGKIRETGKHEDLIRNRSSYYKLIKNQLELGM